MGSIGSGLDLQLGCNCTTLVKAGLMVKQPDQLSGPNARYTASVSGDSIYTGFVRPYLV